MHSVGCVCVCVYERVIINVEMLICGRYNMYKYVNVCVQLKYLLSTGMNISMLEVKTWIILFIFVSVDLYFNNYFSLFC